MSDTAPVVLFEQPAPHIALVTLNRPEARNAVNGEVAQAIDAIVKKTEADPDIWVVVLASSNDKVFSAGADLKEVSQGRVETLWTENGGFAGLVHAKRSKPWIAAVEGLALAGGCELALACDIIVAGEGGGFGLPEVTRGLVAAAGGLYRLPRVLPKAIAIDLILTAERISTERAAQFGMVSRLTPAGKARETALDLAKTITANAPLAVRESLAVVKLADDLDDDALRRLSDEAQSRVQVTEDFFEGSTAFVEKRPPAWKGR